ncbi:sphingomyelin phosphodiesterase 2 [Trichinella spiralis]|uniref:sphingomyelin phosphodiesterase 2 n=1 Tax=Trichinella spiralis TaxID=6334 RepID=UPI0001EFCA9D|nr:sphingomyelin phosphodiesterase 2 [Trichinella spiralis]
MTDFLQLRVLTLNCWGIPLPFPFGSADRKVRIKEIAKELATGKYDIVSLQEIWSENDFNMIHDAVRLVMPYSFYFHNGYAGSGVCVFSKGIILETLMHRYSLNGYVHHIHRGDWFGGKMVGLCRIQFSGININVYATHIHAEYNHDEDVYLAHRVVQAFELGQFMRNTMQNCEMAILMGDLNLRPTDLGYDLIRHSASLKDAWLERSDDVILLACIVHMDSGRGIALAGHHFTDNYISIFINFIDWILFLVWTGLSQFRRESVENDHIEHAYSVGTIFLL